MREKLQIELPLKLPEAMKLLGSVENKITKNKVGETILHL